MQFSHVLKYISFKIIIKIAKHIFKKSYLFYFQLFYFYYINKNIYPFNKNIYHPFKWTTPVTHLNGHYKILKLVGNETGVKLTTTRLGKEMAVKGCIVLRKQIRVK